MSKTSAILHDLPPGAVVWTEVNVVNSNKQPVFGTASSRHWASLHAPFTMEKVSEDCSQNPKHRDRYIIRNNKGTPYFTWGGDGNGCWCREQAELIVERCNAAAALHWMTLP